MIIDALESEFQSHRAYTSDMLLNQIFTWFFGTEVDGPFCADRDITKSLNILRLIENKRNQR
jgi:hypothetical protein